MTDKELQELSKKRNKRKEANEIVGLEIQKLRTDSIQDWATSWTKFEKALKINAWKKKTELRNKAKTLQWEFNKKHYGEVYSEEWNEFIQNILIETYASNKQ